MVVDVPPQPGMVSVLKSGMYVYYSTFLFVGHPPTHIVYMYYPVWPFLPNKPPILFSIDRLYTTPPYSTCVLSCKTVLVNPSPPPYIYSKCTIQHDRLDYPPSYPA